MVNPPSASSRAGRRLAARAAIALGVLSLAACSDGMSRTFGLTRDAPDEFTVTTRAPLSMPPDLTLRAPQPGAPRPQEATPTKAAEATLAPQSGIAQPAAGVDSTGQQALLQAAGPAAPSGIRDQLNADAQGNAQDRSLADRLTSWAKPPPNQAAVVDPQAEADRLRSNAALGQAPDKGDTPVIKKKGSIFDWLDF